MAEGQGDRHQPIIAHLIELRRRLFYVAVTVTIGFALGYLISDHAIAFLTEPLKDAFGDDPARKIRTRNLPEIFSSKMTVSFFLSFLFAFPMIATQIYLFIAPGLYKHEKRVLGPYLIAGPLLFFFGAALAYYYIFPAAWKFLISFEEPLGANGQGMPIMLEQQLGEYLSLVMNVIVAFGLAFQLPVLLTLLVRFGMLSVESLQKGRRYAVVILITVSALLTPPDVVSQLGLFSALYLLYELSIIVSRLTVKPKEASVDA